MNLVFLVVGKVFIVELCSIYILDEFTLVVYVVGTLSIYNTGKDIILSHVFLSGII